MGLLQGYEHTYERTNPIQGLVQGLESGAKHGLLMRQQRMQEEEAESKKDIQEINTLVGLYDKMKNNPAMRQNLGQAITDRLAKRGYIPQSTFVRNEEADNFVKALSDGKHLLDKGDIEGWKQLADTTISHFSQQEDNKYSLSEMTKYKEGIATGAAEQRLGQLGELERAAANNMPELKSSPMAQAERERLIGETEKIHYPTAQKYELEQKKEQTQAASMEGIDIPDLAMSLKNGEIGLAQIKNTRGIAISNKVISKVRKEFPHYNFIYQDANAKYLTSTTNARIIGAVDASLPRVNMLVAQAENLRNTKFPLWNKVLKELSVQTGDPAYTNFMSNRNAIVQEVNTALSGSSQSSDMRVQIELDNLREARSPEQLVGAISNLREALIARKDSSMQYIYPMEVVRGEKTGAQWNDEMKKRYQGKFTPESSVSKPGGSKKSVKEMSDEELLNSL